MEHLRLLTILLFSLSVCVNGAKILGVFPMPAPSHFFTGFRIFKELADRGHEVTMISPYPRDKPIKNYRDVSIAGIAEVFAGNSNSDILLTICTYRIKNNKP